MDAERWKLVDELLQAALQMPAERQEEFLRQQCGGDSELLEEVRSLLTSHRKAGSFLESPGLHVGEVAARRPPGRYALSSSAPDSIGAHYWPNRLRCDNSFFIQFFHEIPEALGLHQLRIGLQTQLTRNESEDLEVGDRSPGLDRIARVGVLQRARGHL